MWRITRDYINPSCGEGPVKAESVDWDKEKAKELFRFRLKDDDGNVYFHGVSTTNDDERAFEPLDDFGTPAYGATVIEYKDKHGNWEAL